VPVSPDGPHAARAAINMYLNGFHFYADDMGRQIEAHHFCHHVNEEFFQCVRFQAAQYAAFRTRRKTYMDINTLLIIVVVVLLLGGGGWYGRGRWF